MNLEPIAWPIVIPNAFILLVNLYYLFIKRDIVPNS